MFDKVADKIIYTREKHEKTYVVTVLLLMCVLIVIAGCFLISILPENRGMTIGDAFWESLRLFLDPGGFLGSKLSAITTIVTCFIVLCGMITFTGGAVGYVTNLISEQIENARVGTKDVSLNNFMVILNWNDRAKTLIFDRMSDKKTDNKNEYIVILADVDDKAAFEDSFEREMKLYAEKFDIKNVLPRIIVRAGNPQNTVDLNKVNIFLANNIFVFRPENAENPDYEVLKTYLAINSLAKMYRDNLGIQSPDEAEGDVYANTIIFETENEMTGKAIENYGFIFDGIRGHMPKFISGQFSLGKLYGQIALMPECKDAVYELVSRMGSTLDEAGIDDDFSFENDLTQYRFRLPLYTYTDIDKDDCVVYLTSELECDYEDVLEEYKKEELGYTIDPKICFSTHKIIIYGVNGKLSYILKSIQANNNEYPERKCFVKLVIPESDLGCAKRSIEESGVKDVVSDDIIVVSDNYDSKRISTEIDSDFHSMLLLADDSESEEEKDRNVFERWLGISSMLSKNEALAKIVEGKIVLEIKNIDNAGIIADEFNRHVIVSNKWVGLLMSMLSNNMGFQDVLIDLVSSYSDNDFEKNGVLESDACDMLSISVRDFFGENIPEFNSKHDLIYKVFKATNEQYVAMGLRAGEDTVFFTNGKKAKGLIKPDLSDNELISLDDFVCSEPSVGTKIVLKPDYYLIVARRTL